MSTENVEFEADSMRPGEYAQVYWSGVPVGIYRRTEAEQEQISVTTRRFLGGSTRVDTNSVLLAIQRAFGRPISNAVALDQAALDSGPFRSKRETHFVFIAINPEFGCSTMPLAAEQDKVPIERLPDGWRGGFFDPCRMAFWDTSGRPYSASEPRSPLALALPPHQFRADGTLLIGLGDPPRALANKDYRPPIDFPNATPQSRLIKAAEYGETPCVRSALDDGADPNRDGQRGSAFHIAIAEGHDRIARLLLEYGADLERKTPTGVTPLCFAILRLDLEQLSLLLDAGADPNRTDVGNPGCTGTPLMQVITGWFDQSERDQAVARLLRAGADPEMRDGGRNALDVARELDDPALLERLIDASEGAQAPSLAGCNRRILPAC